MAGARPGVPGADASTQLILDNPPRSVAEMRRLLEAFAGLMNAGLPRVGALHRGVEIEGARGAAIPAEVVVPEGPGPHPVLVYLHGGGWVYGSPATHRKLAA